MTDSSERAPKTTAWGAIMGHGLALPVLLWGHTTGPACGCALLCYCVTSPLTTLVMVGWDHASGLMMAGTANF